MKWLVMIEGKEDGEFCRTAAEALKVRELLREEAGGARVVAFRVMPASWTDVDLWARSVRPVNRRAA